MFLQEIFSLLGLELVGGLFIVPPDLKNTCFFLNDSLHKEHEFLTIVKHGTMYL